MTVLVKIHKNHKPIRPYRHIALSPSIRKAAFTLAETLITLAIIGVVAAVSLPPMVQNMTERANSERQANIAQKITKAMDMMRAHGALNQTYDSTEAFVDELQKYLKVAKRCDSSNLTNCWPSKTVTMSDGEELEVSKAKTGKNLSLSTETNNVGLILADGASIILNYNPESETIDVGTPVYKYPENGKTLPVGNGKTKEFPYTTTVTGSIDFVMDVNGSRKPNSEVDSRARDIRSFKSAKFSKGGLSCEEIGGTEISGVDGISCIVNLGTGYECISESPYTACTGSEDCNCWAGAREACKAKEGMHLASLAELNTLFNKNCTKGHASCISAIPTSEFFWFPEEYSDHYGFMIEFSDGLRYYTHKYATSARALCVAN